MIDYIYKKLKGEIYINFLIYRRDYVEFKKILWYEET